jgi:NAD-dependent SIR2 family protein deacetylase
VAILPDKERPNPGTEERLPQMRAWTTQARGQGGGYLRQRHDDDYRGDDMSEAEEKRDKFAKIIQKYLEKQPVIILGTGATIPYGLPSMPELADHLKESINDKSTGWDPFLSALEKTGDLERALQETQLTPALTGKIIISTWEFVNQKDLEYYEKLINETGRIFPLKDLFSKLLQSHPKHVKVITTNYDRVAEYAADLAEANIYTGFSGRYLLSFTQNYLQNYPNQNRVDIWKVHGSLDWFDQESRLFFSSPLAKEIPENTVPLVVMPGVVKYQQTHLEPYRTVMNEADKALMQAPCFLCIGYGFNDEHVQPKLFQQVQQKGKPIITIVKKLTETGKKLLFNNPAKSIILEDSENNKTCFHYFENNEYKSETMDGNFWQLGEFLNLWL